MKNDGAVPPLPIHFYDVVRNYLNIGTVLSLGLYNFIGHPVTAFLAAV
jgi:hypothetical protein